MKTAVTLCRVPEAAAGPFVYHQELENGFAAASEHGFDAVELFFEESDSYSIEEITALQQTHGLGIAAVGTGAGMVKHGLSLTDADPVKRDAALQFYLSMMEFGGRLGAPTILGSMQGKAEGSVNRDQALAWLADALKVIREAVGKQGVSVMYEPLNRYETNLLNRVGDAADWIRANDLSNVMILADMFHMNIEENNVAAGMLEGGDLIGHVHFADSNRKAMGFGHTDPAPVIDALRQIGYTGYLSAEVFPLPDADQAASRTMQTLQAHLS